MKTVRPMFRFGSCPPLALAACLAFQLIVLSGCKSEESALKAQPEGSAARTLVNAAVSGSPSSAALPDLPEGGLAAPSVSAQASAGTSSAAPSGSVARGVPGGLAQPAASASAAVGSKPAEKPESKGVTATGSAALAPSGAAASGGAASGPALAASFEAPSVAAPNSADAIAEKVDAVYLPIERFRARFEQKYTAKIAGTTKNSDGVCYIRRPGKVSFSYHTPNKNRVVSDGVTLKIYEAENQQMFTRSVASTEYPGALAFILGKGMRHSFKFDFNESAKWEGGPVIVGTPRVPNPGYEKVLFYIDEELLKKGDPACVRRVLVIDAQGNRNRFDFLLVEQPQSIPDSEFEFIAPEGTNILQ